MLPPLETDTFVTWIADRNTESGPSGMLAERALQDRNWAYGHVIVDEAQELSAMAWRMVLRHCPARSMTVVGDLAQTGTPGGADSWAQVLDPVAAGRWRTERLTVNYRTPAPVMALAAALLPPAAEPPLSVRDSDESPWCAGAEDLADRVRRETELIGTGRVAVIAPPGSRRRDRRRPRPHPRAGPRGPSGRPHPRTGQRTRVRTRSSSSTQPGSRKHPRADGRTCTSHSPGPPAGSGSSVAAKCPLTSRPSWTGLNETGRRIARIGRQDSWPDRECGGLTARKAPGRSGVPRTWLTRLRWAACRVRTAAGERPGLTGGRPPRGRPGLVGIHR